jgi:hypothetical protein
LGCIELGLAKPVRRTRLAHRGGRPVRRKRRPTAAVDKPAAAGCSEGRRGLCGHRARVGAAKSALPAIDAEGALQARPAAQ